MDCKEINPAMFFYFLQSDANFELLSAECGGGGAGFDLYFPSFSHCVHLVI